MSIAAATAPETVAVSAVPSEGTSSRAIQGGHVWALRVVGAVLGAVAAFLPTATDAPARPGQVVLGIVAVIAVWMSGRNDASAVALVAMFGAAGLGVPSPEGASPAVIVPVSAVVGLAAVETMVLVRMWRTAGTTTWEVERHHVGGVLKRLGAGALAALAVSLLGQVELGSPAVIAVAGIAATGLVIVLARPSRS